MPRPLTLGAGHLSCLAAVVAPIIEDATAGLMPRGRTCRREFPAPAAFIAQALVSADSKLRAGGEIIASGWAELQT
jgi:hypothetical protein